MGMLTWFLLAFGAAVAQSGIQALSKTALQIGRYTKFGISFISNALTASLVFGAAYWFFPPVELDPRFWFAALATGVLNAIAFPMLLKAYEVGEFSVVFSMILLTPVFLLVTSYFFLDEAPSAWGIVGVILTVTGLGITSYKSNENKDVPNARLGNMLGLLVALIYSISVNFDKLATQYSNALIAPASANLMIAVGSLLFALVMRKPLQNGEGELPSKPRHHFHLASFGILIALAAVMAATGILHSLALLEGYASYTIAVKRLAVLFGVVWGWLFFHEKNISRKMLGVAAAVAGVVMIVLS
jgi:drug/metabolite transporter (DMT)-like permease